MRHQSQEQKAREEGYESTGHFGYDKEMIKAKAEKERKDGYLAKVVAIPPHPYSRGHHGTGYSVFKKPTEKKLKELAELKLAKETKKQEDIQKVKEWLKEQSADVLFDLIGELKKGGYPGSNETEALSWAYRKNIITR
ncbi:MAG: hypothetical protein KKF27_21225 [Gammaproteobacteria bacterium]|nr:hypothetical protein [Gammaproteobacteria bacterium]